MKHKKIIGNSVTTPYPRPDWNQTDPTKADYIKNKPLIGYRYIAENVDDYLYMITLQHNTVTYAYGTTTQSGELNFSLPPATADDETKEAVLILDLSKSEANTPTVSFEGSIKWLNGEPPTIEVGKIYMFSFVMCKNIAASNIFYTGIGGEFA